MSSASTRVREAVEPAVSAAGYDLEEVTVQPAGRRRLVEIVVDRDGGVDLDDLADLSRAASDRLDESAVMGEAPYVLNVSSPGVDRPLTEPRHWRRAAGRLVTAPLTAGGSVTGRVTSADDREVVFEVSGTPTAYAYDELGRGRIQVEFRRPDEAEGATT